MSKTLEERLDELAARVAKLEEENVKLRCAHPFILGDKVRIKTQRGYYGSVTQGVGHVGEVLAVDISDNACFVSGASVTGKHGWVDFCDLELVQP